VVVGLGASLVALVEVVAGGAVSQADGHSAGAASIALAVAGNVHVGQVGAHAPVQLAAHVEPVAAGELLEVEVLAHGTAQVLGLRVVLSGDGLAADVVVRAGRIVGKVAHASGSGGVVQAEGVLRFRQGSRLIAGHLGHIHAVAEIRIVGRLHGAGSAVQDLADALVVLVTVDGVGQAGVVGQRSAGGARLIRLAGGTGVLRLVHTGTGCGMEDQLVGAVGLDLIVGPAEDVAAAVAAAGIHDEGAICLVGAQVLWLLDKSTRIRTDGTSRPGCSDPTPCYSRVLLHSHPAPGRCSWWHSAPSYRRCSDAGSSCPAATARTYRPPTGTQSPRSRRPRRWPQTAATGYRWLQGNESKSSYITLSGSKAFYITKSEAKTLNIHLPLHPMPMISCL